MPRLGIIAGQGDLPLRLAEACKNRGTDYFVLALNGQTDPDWLVDHPHAWTRIGALGTALDLLKQAQVEEVVMAGGIKRPTLSELYPDWKAAKIIAKIGFSKLGDDTALRIIVNVLEEEGFRVVGADDILDDLLAPEGTLSKAIPSRDQWKSIQRGWGIAKTLGLLDVGQAVVVQDDLVLGVEGVEGTDELVSRCGRLKREGMGPVLVKVAKPQQERRADLPTIGLKTIEKLASCGFSGLVIESGCSIILDKKGVEKEVNKAGLFMISLSAETLEGQPQGAFH